MPWRAYAPHGTSHAKKTSVISRAGHGFPTIDASPHFIACHRAFRPPQLRGVFPFVPMALVPIERTPDAEPGRPRRAPGIFFQSCGFGLSLAVFHSTRVQ